MPPDGNPGGATHPTAATPARRFRTWRCRWRCLPGTHRARPANRRETWREASRRAAAPIYGSGRALQWPLTSLAALLRHNPNYRNTWIAQIVSEIGDYFNNIAVFALVMR